MELGTRRKTVILVVVVMLFIIIGGIGIYFLIPPAETPPIPPPSENQPPVAKIKVNKTVVKIGEPLQFDGTDSHDPEGKELEYWWDFDSVRDVDGDGRGDNDNDSYEAKPIHTYYLSGNYTVTLRVFDGRYYSQPATKVIRVTTEPEVPDGEHSAKLTAWSSNNPLTDEVIFYGLTVTESTHDEIQNITYMLVDNETGELLAQGFVSDIKGVPGAVTFYDMNQDGRLTEGDSFKIDPKLLPEASEGDTFRLIYYLTDEVMAEAYLRSGPPPPPLITLL